MEFKPKAKSTIRPVPLQRRAESPGAVTQRPTRVSLEQRLQRFTSTPVQAQHQAVRPVLQAAGLRQQEEQYVALQRQHLTNRASTAQPASRSGEPTLLR